MRYLFCYRVFLSVKWYFSTVDVDLELKMHRPNQLRKNLGTWKKPLQDFQTNMEMSEVLQALRESSQEERNGVEVALEFLVFRRHNWQWTSRHTDLEQYWCSFSKHVVAVFPNDWYSGTEVSGSHYICFSLVQQRAHFLDTGPQVPKYPQANDRLKLSDS